MQWHTKIISTVPPKEPKIDRYSRRNRPFRAPNTVVGVKRNARISTKKLGLIARLVRRMSAHDAELHCGISDKKAGRIALDLIRSTIRNALKRGFDAHQLIVGACMLLQCKIQLLSTRPP